MSFDEIPDGEVKGILERALDEMLNAEVSTEPEYRFMSVAEAEYQLSKGMTKPVKIIPIREPYRMCSKCTIDRLNEIQLLGGDKI